MFTSYHTESNFNNLLQMFVDTDKTKHLKLLFDENPDYSANCYFIEPLLKTAIRNCNLKIVRLLLDRDINIEDPRENWVTYCDKLLNLPNNSKNCFWVERKKTLTKIKNLLKCQKEPFSIITLSEIHQDIDDIESITKDDGYWDGLEIEIITNTMIEI